MSASNPGGTAARVPPPPAVVPAPAGDKPAGATSTRGKGLKGGVTKSLAGGKGVNRAAAGANAPLAASAKEGEVRFMMFGFGDDLDPLQETVDLVEDILMDYITTTATAAVDVAIAQGSYAKAGAGGGTSGSGSKAAVDKDAALLGPRPDLKVEHLKFVVRKDARKYARIQELLQMESVIKSARQAVEQGEEDLAREYKEQGQ